MKTRWLQITLTIIAFGLAMLAIAWGAYFRAGLDVTIGMHSVDRIRAPHIMEDVRGTEANRQAALEFAYMLEKIYTIDQDQWPFVANNLEILHGDIAVVRTAYQREQAQYEQAQAIWEAEVAAQDEANEQAQRAWRAARDEAIENETDIPPQPDIPLPPSPPQFMEEYLTLFVGLPMRFTEDEQRLLVAMDDDSFALMWGVILYVAERVQLNHEIDEIDFATGRAITMALAGVDGLDRATADLIENIVLHHLRPNVIPDNERNEQRFDEHSRNFYRVWIQPQQIIVDEGELITEDIYFLLGQFGLLRSDSIRDHVVPLLGVGVLVAALFLISLMYVAFYRPSMAASNKETMLLFTIFVLSLSVAWVFRDFYILGTPAPVIALFIFPMLVSLLIDRKCAMVLTFAMVLICFFVVEGSMAYLLLYATAGALIALLSRFGTERNKVFFVGLMVTAALFVLSVSVTLIIERVHAFSDLPSLFSAAGFAAASGMLTVIICTGSLPFWETVFGVVTPVKLLDLTNPTNPILRRLTIEAPGTYHHSLIVANLAETAAYDIGANSHAARVGGYYHDIGKLKFPHYFAENLDGENPHDLLDPTDSAQIIFSHVSHGLALAGEHRLPQFVRDIINEHHGTTKLQYFYAKAAEADPNVDEKDYRYPGVIPQTRESACVMLADSVEAAVRATMPKLNSVDEVEKTIKNIVRGKLNDGQLADSQLSIKDVTVIEESFFRVLKGMYHERIAYPKAAPKAAPAGDGSADRSVEGSEE
ncbi:MAG: HDIG domain-containing protein [Defluviitaleaceae bacterium]|nr:HDIG domain-containing protein [Defluviitaleaceae bacterium]